MKKFYSLKAYLFTCLLLLLSGNIYSQQLSFPGADGYGRYTTGGRGGFVYEVTNLNDSGTGSLRAGVEMSGTRTIVFRVSGTIQLQSALKINNGNVTIAGQTAPGDGICIAGFNFQLNTDNIIIRFIRFRLGNENVATCECDALGGRFLQDIMIDHCSMSWSIDEVASFYQNANMTMQWCIMSESLYNSGHVKGSHGYGGIQGGDGATFHHNLYASNTSRNPRLCGARYHIETADIDLTDFRNNVIFNWGYYTIYGGEYGHQNIVNNYFKSGPATKTSAARYMIASINRGSEADPGKWYIHGNYVEGYPSVSADNWSGGVQGADATTDTARVLTPFTYYISETQTAEEAYADVLKYVGCSYPKRDAIDTRILNEVSTGVCGFGDTYVAQSGIANHGIIDSQSSVGAWPSLNSTTAPDDADHDGMPDTWEIAHALNPNSASDANLISTDGYTNLELYMNSLVESVMGIPTNVSVAENLPVTVSPTVFESYINVSVEEAGHITVYITDITSRLVFKESLQLGNAGTKIDLESLHSGVYFCTISNGVKMTTVKIIKKID